MLNKNRKGVSEVVANVLIVLLVIVGIAVIWSVVKPTIERASDTVQSDCFTVQVEPQSCVGATAVGACTPIVATTAGCPALATLAACEPTTSVGCIWTPKNYNVVVARSPGAGSFENIELVFSDGTNTARVAASPAVTQQGLQELGTYTINEDIPASTVVGAASNALTLAGDIQANIVLRANGQLCQLTTQAISCS